MDCCNILDTVTSSNLLIKEYKYWKLYLRGRVKTLGSCVLLTKEHCKTMSEIPQEAISELSEITKQFESVLNSLEGFKPDKYNYQMNMMKENHTHFNIFPRYSTVREFEGTVFKDLGWPGGVGENLEIEDQILMNLASMLRKSFN